MTSPTPARAFTITTIYTSDYLGGIAYTRTTFDPVMAARDFAENDGSDTQATLHTSTDLRSWEPLAPADLMGRAYRALELRAQASPQEAAQGAGLRRALDRALGGWLDTRLRPHERAVGMGAPPTEEEWKSAAWQWAAVIGQPVSDGVLDLLRERFDADPGGEDEAFFRDTVRRALGTLDRLGTAQQVLPPQRQTLAVLAGQDDFLRQFSGHGAAFAAVTAQEIQSASYGAESRLARALLQAASERSLDQALDQHPIAGTVLNAVAELGTEPEQQLRRRAYLGLGPDLFLPGPHPLYLERMASFLEEGARIVAAHATQGAQLASPVAQQLRAKVADHLVALEEAALSDLEAATLWRGSDPVARSRAISAFRAADQAEYSLATAEQTPTADGTLGDTAVAPDERDLRHAAVRSALEDVDAVHRQDAALGHLVSWARARATAEQAEQELQQAIDQARAAIESGEATAVPGELDRAGQELREEIATAYRRAQQSVRDGLERTGVLPAQPSTTEPSEAAEKLLRGQGLTSLSQQAAPVSLDGADGSGHLTDGDLSGRSLPGARATVLQQTVALLEPVSHLATSWNADAHGDQMLNQYTEQIAAQRLPEPTGQGPTAAEAALAWASEIQARKDAFIEQVIGGQVDPNQAPAEPDTGLQEVLDTLRTGKGTREELLGRTEEAAALAEGTRHRPATARRPDTDAPGRPSPRL